MSKRKPTKRKAAPEARAAQAFYVYAIGESEQLSRIAGGRLPEGIEEGAPVELIKAEGLAAIVSRVPLSEFGEDVLEERLSDPAWTAKRAMRHEEAIEHFAAREAVVPVRFATIYLDRARVERMLREQATSLRRIIERLRGREEWGVNLYQDSRALLQAVSRLSPRLREMTERAAKLSPGQAYLLNKKIDAARADEARIEVRRVISEIEDGLAKYSAGSARLQVLRGEAGEAGRMAAKLAFLVERERFDEFRAEAERFAERHAVAGFTLEMTGPWPAYNFTSETGEAR
jgi:hypothetical protein